MGLASTARRKVAFWMMVSIGLAGLNCHADAADLTVHVIDAQGHSLANAAIMATWAGAPVASGAGKTAELSQRHLKFNPDVLVVAKDTSVTFPNYDRTRHQVYSFSAAKTFNLKLYVGRPQRPVVFDNIGVVTLGCDIHDFMQAFIVVTDKPRHAVTDKHGRAVLHNLPSKPLRLSIWHPWMPNEDARVDRRLNAGTSTIHVRLDVAPPSSARRDQGPSLQDRFDQLSR